MAGSLQPSEDAWTSIETSSGLEWIVPTDAWKVATPKDSGPEAVEVHHSNAAHHGNEKRVPAEPNQETDGDHERPPRWLEGAAQVVREMPPPLLVGGAIPPLLVVGAMTHELEAVSTAPASPRLPSRGRLPTVIEAGRRCHNTLASVATALNRARAQVCKAHWHLPFPSWQNLLVMILFLAIIGAMREKASDEFTIKKLKAETASLTCRLQAVEKSLSTLLGQSELSTSST